jgi:hypothetical protein
MWRRCLPAIERSLCSGAGLAVHDLARNLGDGGWLETQVTKFVTNVLQILFFRVTTYFIN